MGVNKININNNDSNYAHSIFDISEYTGKTYETLSDALADVPDGKKKGGMTVSFVSTSDNSNNQYVQYRLMSIIFNSNVNAWQSSELFQYTGYSTTVSMSQNAVTEEFNKVPDIKIAAQEQSTNSLDISDEQGNVIARFKDGHISTQQFDSKNVATGIELKSDNTSASLNLSDEQGNVIVRFENGHIKTKNFDSSNSQQSELGKQWEGKTIAWYGTSIPAGYPYQSQQSIYAYPNIIAQKLKARILNYSVPNGVIRGKKFNGDPLTGAHAQLSFTLTSSSVNYQNSLLNLIGTQNEPDLFVFDYGVNDIGDDGSELQSQIDLTSFDTNSFISSCAFVFKELLNIKPKARIMLLTHYSDDGIQPSSGKAGKDCWKEMNDRIILLGNYWNIPVIDARHIVGWRNTNPIPTISGNGSNNMSQYISDGIHPAAGQNIEAVNLLANLYYHEIIKFY